LPKHAPGPRCIVVAFYEGASLLDLAGPLEAFRAASVFAAPERRVTYEYSVVSVRGGPLRNADGFETEIFFELNVHDG
jgi:transcriptional regulator GlxA family with amidase domain